jgi:hypothetical protein
MSREDSDGGIEIWGWLRIRLVEQEDRRLLCK